MSSQFKYTAGLNHVGSYQASARPFIKAVSNVPATGAIGDALEISFPKVTKFITVRNDGTGNSASVDIKLAFASGGMAMHTQKSFITIAESASFSADFRVTRLYLMTEVDGECNATVTAGLTNIDAFHLSGSWEGLDGVETSS